MVESTSRWKVYFCLCTISLCQINIFCFLKGSTKWTFLSYWAIFIGEISIQEKYERVESPLSPSFFLIEEMVYIDFLNFWLLITFLYSLSFLLTPMSLLLKQKTCPMPAQTPLGWVLFVCVHAWSVCICPKIAWFFCFNFRNFVLNWQQHFILGLMKAFGERHPSVSSIGYLLYNCCVEVSAAGAKTPAAFLLSILLGPQESEGCSFSQHE